MGRLALVGLVLLLALLAIPLDILRYRAPGQEVTARGGLSLRGVGLPVGDYSAFGARLEPLGIAPLSDLYLGPPHAMSLPRAIIRPQEECLPPLTLPSSTAGERVDLTVSNVVALPGMCAMVYGWYRAEGGDCVLITRQLNRGKMMERHTVLLRHYELDRVWLAGDTVHRQLTVLLFGQDVRPDGSREGMQKVFAVDAPAWTPLEVPLGSLQWELCRLAGQTLTGDIFYLFVYRDSSLWTIDRKTQSVSRLCADQSWGEMWAIPSPDASLVAISEPLAIQNRRGRDWLGVYLADPGAGRVTPITYRRKGRAADQAMGWSLAVPNRLFFIEHDGNLWQLDIDRKQVFP